jgi:predicted nucleotidyltransferase
MGVIVGYCHKVTTHYARAFPVIIRIMSQSVWTPEELAVFRANAARLRAQDRELEKGRRERAWKVAQAAAELLRQDFHASRIVVFGSLARDGSFTQWSDVDIAAWGIDPKDTLRAIGAVMDMDAGMDINLVDVNTATPALIKAIDQDGVEL